MCGNNAWKFIKLWLEDSWLLFTTSMCKGIDHTSPQCKQDQAIVTEEVVAQENEINKLYQIIGFIDMSNLIGFSIVSFIIMKLLQFVR